MLASGAVAQPATRGSITSDVRLWNDQWLFDRADAPASAPDSDFQQVTLPHTARLEEPWLPGWTPFQGICTYRKHFTADPAWRGKIIQVRFDGAMQVAEVSLNGQLLAVHKGGYLPFIVNLGPHLNWSGGNLLTVRLDNRDAPEIPPGKPQRNLDFTYDGGLYRDVWLRVCEPLHISDVFEANQQAGGGIFVRTESVTPSGATIFAQADVRNDGSTPEDAASIRFTILDASGAIAEKEILLAVQAGGRAAAASPLPIPAARLRRWSPDLPALYTLRTELLRAGVVVETNSTRFGVRTLAYDDRLGFILNGQPLRIRGANRHQDFPWLGNAVPDNAQYRDIARLKDAGFNFLRLAHYPQSEAVMDACDELGMMVAPCTPGWQHFGTTAQFTDLARQDIREMVRWHRNHPSAIMWEVSLNETYGHDAFYKECAAIARAEYPGGQLFVAGDSSGSKDVSYYNVPYTGWPGGGYNRPAAPGFSGRKRSFTREYSDYDTGINNRIGRGDGEEAMLAQAWGAQWTHNTNNGSGWMIGDSRWAGVDSSRGGSPSAPVGRWGVLDFLRLPKFSFYFYQSQRDARQPSIFIPHYWDTRPSPTRVVVFSNCDEVELRLNGRAIGRQPPDNGPDAPLGADFAQEDMLTNYMKIGKTMQDFEAMIAQRSKQPHRYPLYTGNDCRHLDHSPFTFPLVPYESGTLEAIGYIGGNEAAHFTRRTPGKPAALRMVSETLGRPLDADGTDAIFIRAEIVDKNGELVPSAAPQVTWNVSGSAALISEPAVKAEAGIATALIHAINHPGAARIEATAPGLDSALCAIVSAGP
jgi:beta-galactosidase